MNTNNNRFSRGKAGVAALALTLAAGLALIGLLGTGARAQGAGKATYSDTWFGPVALEPIDPNMPFTSESMVVRMLLPAVQKVREAACRMQVVGNGFSLDLPILGSDVPTLRTFKLWTELNPAAPGYVLSVKAEDGEVRRMPIEHRELTIKIRGVMQSDKVVVEPESSSVQHNTGALQNVGGDNVPILIGMLIPAIQKVR